MANPSWMLPTNPWIKIILILIIVFMAGLALVCFESSYFHKAYQVLARLKSIIPLNYNHFDLSSDENVLDFFMYVDTLRGNNRIGKSNTETTLSLETRTCLYLANKIQNGIELTEDGKIFIDALRRGSIPYYLYKQTQSEFICGLICTAALAAFTVLGGFI